MLELIYSFFTGYDSSAILAVAPALPIATSVLGGIFGNLTGNRADLMAARAREKAIQQWLSINIPDPEDQKLYLEEMKQQGVLTPELEQNILQGESQMQSIALDPALRQAQMGALSQLGDIADSGGRTLSDKAQLNSIMQEIATDTRGRNEAVQQEMARRGMGGSSMELGSKLMNQQNASQLAANQGLNSAAMSEQRALEAMLQGANLGGQIRGQDFGEAASKAQADDAISKFNAQLAAGTQQRNVDRGNYAQGANLGEKQRIADMNAQMGNQQQMYNKQLGQQQFENRAKIAAGASGQYGQQAAADSAAAQASRNRWADIGGGLGSTLATALSDDKKKKSIG